MSQLGLCYFTRPFRSPPPFVSQSNIGSCASVNIVVILCTLYSFKEVFECEVLVANHNGGIPSGRYYICVLLNIYTGGTCQNRKPHMQLTCEYRSRSFDTLIVETCRCITSAYVTSQRTNTPMHTIYKDTDCTNPLAYVADEIREVLRTYGHFSVV